MLSAMEWEVGTFGMKRSRLLRWQRARTRSSGKLLEAARKLCHAAETLEIEIRQTEEDIRKVHRAYEGSSRKKRRSG